MLRANFVLAEVGNLRDRYGPEAVLPGMQYGVKMYASNILRSVSIWVHTPRTVPDLVDLDKTVAHFVFGSDARAVAKVRRSYK